MSLPDSNCSRFWKIFVANSFVYSRVRLTPFCREPAGAVNNCLLVETNADGSVLYIKPWRGGSATATLRMSLHKQPLSRFGLANSEAPQKDAEICETVTRTTPSS